jgi:5-methyltetrahydrofolate--homocysteine methyltransferase
MSLLEELKIQVEEGMEDEALELTKKAIDDGINPKEILDDALISAMKNLGEKYSSGEIYVPEMLMSANAMKLCMDILRPKLIEAKVKPVGKCVIGTVKDDLHDIGQNLVSTMLEGAGFEVYNLGSDVSTDEFLNSIKEKQPHILALSAMLTTTMLQMEVIIKTLKEEAMRDKVKVIIGGAPITPDFAREIGADGYGKDATEAVEMAKKLLSNR